MSFGNDGDEYVYQPSIFVKIALVALIVFATFAIPYSLFLQTPTSDTVSPNPVPTDNAGSVPPMLTFDSDTSVPATATLSLSTPYESGWDITKQDGSLTTYNYTPLSCSIDTQVMDMEFASTGQAASIEALSNYLDSPIDASVTTTVSELSYNLTSTAQVIGVGSTVGSKYVWTYARALTTINKAVIVSTSCSSKEAMYESADTLRSQFGILLKP